MAVKRSRSASRVLTVLEAVASLQPVGVSALARAIGDDKSAVQRALMTLADDGWVRPSPTSPSQWELTPRMLSAARLPESTMALRHQAREALEYLRDESLETVFLIVPDGDHFVVIEALEGRGRQMLRNIPPVGMVVPVRPSATGRALLAFASSERQVALLGEAPSAAMQAEFAATRARGFAVNNGDIDPGSVTIAAPIFDAAGEAVGTVVVGGPRERIQPDRYEAIGTLAIGTAARLSASTPLTWERAAA